MDETFVEFSVQVGKAHNQLMEGAITYEEFFNRTAQLVMELASLDDYSKYLESLGLLIKS